MKRFCTLLLGILLLGSMNSCDWVRSTLGMPTSTELRLKKEQLIKDSLDKAAALQKAALLEQARQDSLAAAQAEKAAMKRYHVVFGSFKVPSNADRMMAKLPQYGFTPQRLDFANGFAVISAYQTDNLTEAYNQMNKLFSLDITPYDIWIYDISQKLHQ